MKFTPSALTGVIDAPPSKSAAHRALLIAYLSGEAKVFPVAMSDDITATLGCLKALGAECSAEKSAKSENFVVTVKRGTLPERAVLNAKESGSTMRFFLPLAAALGVACEFRGEGLLPSRPYRAFAETLARHGAEFSTKEGLPLVVSGKLEGGEFTLPGNISSQYVTGLLFSLPLLKGDSKIVLTDPLESKGYVDLTIQMLSEAGVTVEETDYGYFVRGNQTFRATEITVEGDYSNAAFFLAAGALSGNVTVRGLNPASVQSDREILNILARMGSRMILFENRVQVKKSELRCVDVDVSGIPDLAPILSVLMAAAKGKGRLRNAARLRLKECDRFRAIIENLNRAGVKAEADGDDIIIEGGTLLGGALSGYRDHRMVMSAAIMGTVVPVTVTTDTAVAKSFPDFYRRYRELNGIAEAEASGGFTL